MRCIHPSLLSHLHASIPLFCLTYSGTLRRSWWSLVLITRFSGYHHCRFKTGILMWVCECGVAQCLVYAVVYVYYLLFYSVIKSNLSARGAL
jgi:hypothetical protein